MAASQNSDEAKDIRNTKTTLGPATRTRSKTEGRHTNGGSGGIKSSNSSSEEQTPARKRRKHDPVMKELRRMREMQLKLS